MIRHGRLRWTKAAAVFPLPVAMIELPFGALLVPAVGAAPLLAAGLLAALVAAVAVSAVAVRTDEENRVAALTKAKPAAAEPLRHEPPPCVIAGGTGQRQWSRGRLKPALFGFTCPMVAEHGTLPR